MWEATKATLGYSAHDIRVIFMCMAAGLLGALVHITIVFLKAKQDNDRMDEMKMRLFAYGFMGQVIGFCIGFLFAGILRDTPSAIRTILGISLLAGWQAYRFFRQGVFDAGH